MLRQEAKPEQIWQDRRSARWKVAYVTPDNKAVIHKISTGEILTIKCSTLYQNYTRLF